MSVFLRKTLRNICISASCFCALFSANASAENVEDVFSDITENYEYLTELQALYDRGMILPFVGDEFRPDALLQRDEFVGITLEASCERCILPHTSYELLKTYGTQQSYFDVRSVNPYFYCIAQADNSDIVVGYEPSHRCENDTFLGDSRPFCPTNTINLQEALAVLMRSSGIFSIQDNQNIIGNIYAGNISADLALDMPAKNSQGQPYTYYGYFQKALSYAVTNRGTDGNSRRIPLVSLDENGKLNPSRAITREQFLIMAYVVLQSNSCSQIEEGNIAGFIALYDASCSPASENCNIYDGNTNRYDLRAVTQTSCEGSIDEAQGYIWRLTHLSSGNQYIHFGRHLDNYHFLNAGSWNIQLRVVDNCGSSSYFSSYIYVENDKNTIDMFTDGGLGGTVVGGGSSGNFALGDSGSGESEGGGDQGGVGASSYIGVPINLGIELPKNDGELNPGITVYDDDCNAESLQSCSQIYVGNDRKIPGDVNNMIDFSGNDNSSCLTGETQYLWTFRHLSSNYMFNILGKYVDNVDLGSLGLWHITLFISDNCGKTGSISYSYNNTDSSDNIQLGVQITTNPISGIKNLLVDLEGTALGGVPPFRYSWKLGDGALASGRSLEHVYNQSGYFPVTLTLTDARGNRAQATSRISVFENPDICSQDSDGDGIGDCVDACPYQLGDDENSGCPIYETRCQSDCSCSSGYTCASSDSLSCSSAICIPEIESYESSCAYSPGGSHIFGNALCSSCPCSKELNFLADMRKCDIIFPAITSPSGRKIYSRGEFWRVK